MMVMMAATLAVVLLKAIALLAKVPLVSLTASTGDFSSDISTCGLYGHCWWWQKGETSSLEENGRHHIAAKQSHSQSICEKTSGGLVSEIFGKNLRSIIYNFCRGDGSAIRAISFCACACDPILFISGFDKSNQNHS